jgi:acyl dehydratase
VSEDFQDRVGHRFPGGTVTVPHYENWLWCDSVLADHPAHISAEAARALGYPAPVVHPGLVYFACVRGARVSFADIFRLMDFDEKDGPMFGEQRLAFTEPVFVGVEYEGSGEVTGVVRKAGKRAGVFDIVTFVIRLTRDGREVVSSTSSFVLPRRHLTEEVSV